MKRMENANSMKHNAEAPSQAPHYILLVRSAGFFT